uniref:(northern house mosquito) hypothetical protein n=1 Tax=Culex pipiens TaxID=7175 RepID=A0A8D8AYV4_CULPI
MGERQVDRSARLIVRVDLHRRVQQVRCTIDGLVTTSSGTAFGLVIFRLHRCRCRPRRTRGAQDHVFVGPGDRNRTDGDHRHAAAGRVRTVVGGFLIGRIDKLSRIARFLVDPLRGPKGRIVGLGQRTAVVPVQVS